LGGARSSLFHEQLRIFHAARKHCGARWLVWENVPGAFSSHAGRDFAVVVGSMAGAGLVAPADGWGSEGMAVGENGLVEWCVLDAQWFGVAQRRRRVFAVLDTGDWASRPPVLLERDGLRGDFAPSRETGEDVAPTISARTSGGGGLGTDFDLDGGLIPAWPAEVACTLNASFGSKQGLEDQHVLGGGQLFVPATRCGLPDDRNGAAVRPGDGDADSCFRGRLRCSAHVARRRVRRKRGWNGPRHAFGASYGV
jgi:DNA (cytosine-5)-methyltransferase 1